MASAGMASRMRFPMAKCALSAGRGQRMQSSGAPQCLDNSAHTSARGGVQRAFDQGARGLRRRAARQPALRFGERLRPWRLGSGPCLTQILY